MIRSIGNLLNVARYYIPFMPRPKYPMRPALIKIQDDNYDISKAIAKLYETKLVIPIEYKQNGVIKYNSFHFVAGNVSRTLLVAGMIYMFDYYGDLSIVLVNNTIWQMCYIHYGLSPITKLNTALMAEKIRKGKPINEL